MGIRCEDLEDAVIRIMQISLTARKHAAERMEDRTKDSDRMIEESYLLQAQLEALETRRKT